MALKIEDIRVDDLVIFVNSTKSRRVLGIQGGLLKFEWGGTLVAEGPERISRPSLSVGMWVRPTIGCPGLKRIGEVFPNRIVFDALVSLGSENEGTILEQPFGQSTRLDIWIPVADPVSKKVEEMKSSRLKLRYVQVNDLVIFCNQTYTVLDKDAHNNLRIQRCGVGTFWMNIHHLSRPKLKVDMWVRHERFSTRRISAVKRHPAGGYGIISFTDGGFSTDSPAWFPVRVNDEDLKPAEPESTFGGENCPGCPSWRVQGPCEKCKADLLAPPQPAVVEKKVSTDHIKDPYGTWKGPTPSGWDRCKNGEIYVRDENVWIEKGACTWRVCKVFLDSPTSGRTMTLGSFRFLQEACDWADKHLPSQQ